MELLLYELTLGKGNLFLHSLSNLITTRKSIKEQNQKYSVLRPPKKSLACNVNV